MLWELTVESAQQPLFIRTLCEPEPLSNHEEQLSCPASWCAHSSAAVSGLLWHQMAVSILTGAIIPFCNQPYPAFHTNNVKTRDVIMLQLHLCCVFVGWVCVCVCGVEALWQLWKGPQHSSSCLWWGKRLCVRCMCIWWRGQKISWQRFRLWRETSLFY